ncbi:MAG: HAD family phosphatase [Lachnospiraceae bacterium]|nr:HAD family phosphatase [Lachnospiraceae bacterium]
MITSVIFDIGMVLAYFRGREMYEDMGITGEDFETIASATIRNPMWNEFDRGLIPTEEIIEIFVKDAPQFRKEITAIYETPEVMVRMYDYTLPWIRELKERGYKVYALSNWSKPTYEACIDSHLSFLKEMDGEIISFREHLLKPEREIYQLLCDRFNITPEEAVFLDDNIANVEAARAFGLNAIHFVNYEQGKAELEEYLQQ